MTDIRELLREATEDLALEHTDPVSQVQRATTHRRRTMAAISCVAIAVVVAIVVPLTVVSGRTASGPVAPKPTPVPHSRSVLQDWAPDDVEAAAGFGSIWGLSAAGNGAPGTSWVDRLNPVTGARIRRFSIPAPTSKITVGAGRVWVIGQNAGGGGTSYITTIDPKTGAIATLRLTNQRAEPYDITISDGSAWVTMQLLNQVWRLTPTSPGPGGSSEGITKAVITVSGGPTEIAAASNGEIWVQGDDTGRLTHIVPTTDSGRLGETVRWSLPIFGRFSVPSGDALLAAGSGEVVGRLLPEFVDQPGGHVLNFGVLAKGQVLAAIVTRHGIFVSTTQRTYYYRLTTVTPSAVARPTSSIPDGGASLADDGHGVVIGAGDGGLVHWIPAF
jgi:hypothetical protein